VRVTSIYDAALGYEIAFSYRDVPAEVDALVRLSGGEPASVLEICAGPAEHAVECARRGWRATAVDQSPSMLDRARENAASAGVTVDLIRADMRDFTLAEPVDLAFCMISSISYVLTLDDMITHLSTVRRALRPGGCYVIEGSHPTEQFGAKATQTTWTCTRDGISSTLSWGEDTDLIDPVTQITQLHVTVATSGPGGEHSVTSIEPDRFWTRDEMHAAARLAGMRVDGEYGDFSGDVGLADPSAWRMIHVLRPNP
ncbi:MAG TPA: class I SAM-dependent methyltransferase, partial [Micromonosporaceae bacterium]|nr:class I SAM-dependent methyltransferase [Micromonosporaceae bacterium]